MSPALISEPIARVPLTSSVDYLNHAATIALPFIAPPSSPASFLPSDPPSVTQSHVGLLSLASLTIHAYSSDMTAPIFLIGPYAHETQLVSPPVFSTFTTEPSTASFTPPPELVQMTTPSPKVPFAQLPLFIGYEHLANYKWGSRVGSGSITPNGWGSRLGCGALTPNGGLSRLGSGTLTTNGAELPSRDSNQIPEVVSLVHSELRVGFETNDVVNHRVSFELTSEDIPTCIVMETFPSPKLVPETTQEAVGGTQANDLVTEDAQTTVRTDNAVPRRDSNGKAEECHWHQKRQTISHDSSKDFNFSNPKDQGSDKSSINYELWTSEPVASEELGPKRKWTFFPMLQSGIS